MPDVLCLYINESALDAKKLRSNGIVSDFSLNRSNAEACTYLLVYTGEDKRVRFIGRHLNVVRNPGNPAERKSERWDVVVTHVAEIRDNEVGPDVEFWSSRNPVAYRTSDECGIQWDALDFQPTKKIG